MDIPFLIAVFSRLVYALPVAILIWLAALLVRITLGRWLAPQTRGAIWQTSGILTLLALLIGRPFGSTWPYALLMVDVEPIGQRAAYLTDGTILPGIFTGDMCLELQLGYAQRIGIFFDIDIANVIAAAFLFIVFVIAVCIVLKWWKKRLKIEFPPLKSLLVALVFFVAVFFLIFPIVHVNQILTQPDYFSALDDTPEFICFVHTKTGEKYIETFDIP